MKATLGRLCRQIAERAYVSKQAAGAAFAAVAILLGSAMPAEAISISIDSLTVLPGNTEYTLRTDNRSRSFDFATNVTNSGGSAADVVGSSVSAGTRYAWTQTSDTDGLFSGDSPLTTTSNYRVEFTVSGGNPAAVYDVTIDTARIGALVTRDEASASATATINALSGTLNGVGNAALGLAGPLTRNSNSTGALDVNQSNTLVLTGLTGTNSFVLEFSWTNFTTSENSINGGDEGVVLFGLDTRINSKVGAADDYPGTSGRTDPAADGHFVNITAEVTAVPEPSTWVLCILGGMGLAYVAKRRRS